MIVEKLPFAVLMLGSMAMTGYAQAHVGAFYPSDSFSLIDSLAQPGCRLCFYLQKTLLPFALSTLYVFRPANEIGAGPLVLCGLIAAGMTGAAVAVRRRWPAGLVVWFSYIVLVGPVIGLLQAGPHFVADRYSYLIGLPWAVLVGSGAVWLAAQNRSAALAATAIVTLILSALTYKQTQVWHDSLSLWSQTIEASPSRMAYNYRGNARAAADDLDGAIADFTTAFAFDHRYVEPLIGRSNAYLEKKDYDRAISDYDAILAANPKYAEGYGNRGYVKANKAEIVRGSAAPGSGEYAKALLDGARGLRQVAGTRSESDGSIRESRKSPGVPRGSGVAAR